MTMRKHQPGRELALTAGTVSARLDRLERAAQQAAREPRAAARSRRSGGRGASKPDRDKGGDAGRSVPELAPRIKLHIAARRVDETNRMPGVGTLHQIRGDVARLSRLGGTHIVLDTTVPGEPRPPGTVEPNWRWIERFREEGMELAGAG